MTLKPLLVFQGPIATMSGYGKHARDLLISLIKMDKYDIKVVSTRWGNTPLNQLNTANEWDNEIIKRILTTNLPKKPDIFVQVSVANEFTPAGVFNIGITAGVETTIAPMSWIEGCNRMDLILTSATFAKEVLQSTSYLEKDTNTGQVISERKITTPIEVLFEGTDPTFFSSPYRKDAMVDAELKKVKESFNFLVVGHWLKGNLGEDRKNLGMLIKVFLGVFKNRNPKPGLILKTSGATFSVLDRERIIKRIESIKRSIEGDLPNIYLLHGDLKEEQLVTLYRHKKVKAMLSIAKGEGYGRPLQEFSFTGKPIVASNWSGQVDFLNEYGILIGGELTKVDKSAADDFILKEASWFTVDYNQFAGAMNDLFTKYEEFESKSKILAPKQRSAYSLDKMGKDFEELLNRYVKLPEYVALELPTLNLPKLKKVTSNG